MGCASADVHVAGTFGVLQMEFLVLSTVFSSISSQQFSVEVQNWQRKPDEFSCSLWSIETLLILSVLVPYIAFILP